MCGFIVIWTYMSFSQFLIIWSGNLPEEIHYYLDRSSSDLYRAVILVLMLGHFFLPFMVLLQRRIKRNVTTLCWVAFWVLSMRLVDIFLWFNPAFHHGDTSLPWRDILVYACALTGFAGVYFWYFLGQLTKMPLLALNDPRLHEALSPGQGHGAGEEAADHA
jgi:drug/metabolite transporter (DMT)-like permease